MQLPSPNPPLPAHAPVMVLPEATLFPHALLPLFIFETRYREMLAWALEEDRMFCVALMKPDVIEATSSDDFHQTAGLGLVRACVGHEDGTSHLVLQGLARVKFTGFLQEEPFRIARLHEVPAIAASEEEGEMLSAQLLARCAEQRAHGVSIPEQLDEQLAQVSDPAVLGDIVAHTFVREARRRQEVLEEGDVAARLRVLIRHLTEEMPPP